jgi:uncharacterized protein YndB with AHSA1/START domain
MTEAKNVIVERTYRATIDEVWALWTTKDGFESWWGPEGFRVEVHELDARVGGALRYEMIADAPEAIAAMKNMGQPTAHDTRGTFSEIEPRKRIVLTHVIDFFAGKPPFESTMIVELSPAGDRGDRVRMVVTLVPMPYADINTMQEQGMESQLRKLDRRFAM